MPESVLARLRWIALEAEVDLVMVCGAALREWSLLPHSQRRSLCMEYFDGDQGERAELTLNRDTATIVGIDTERGMSVLQAASTALWVFVCLPTEDAVSIIDACSLRG